MKTKTIVQFKFKDFLAKLTYKAYKKGETV